MITKQRKSRTEPMQNMADKPSHFFTKFVGNVKTKPHSEKAMSLGIFSDKRPAKGFSIAMNQPKGDDQQVFTSITASGGGNQYEYTLHIVNNSNKLISAEVWRI